MAPMTGTRLLSSQKTMGMQITARKAATAIGQQHGLGKLQTLDQDNP